MWNAPSDLDYYGQFAEPEADEHDPDFESLCESEPVLSLHRMLFGGTNNGDDEQNDRKGENGVHHDECEHPLEDVIGERPDGDVFVPNRAGGRKHIVRSCHGVLKDLSTWSLGEEGRGKSGG